MSLGRIFGGGDGPVSIAGAEYAPDTEILTCRHVLEGKDADLVAIDGEGALQVLCAEPRHQVSDGRMITARDAAAILRGAALPRLSPGMSAARQDGAWQVGCVEP